jgi:uncharacterized membrane protein YbhN (UPF0104 family)
MNNIFSFLRTMWRKPAARALTSVCILIVLLLKLPLSELWNTIRLVSPYLWTVIVAAFLCGHLIGALKWMLLINVGKSKLPFLLAVRYYFAGLFANLFLPSIAGGDVVRAGLAIRFNNEKEAIVIGSLLDRLLDTGSLLFIIFMAGLYSPTALANEDRKMLLWLLLLILGLGFCFIFFAFGPRLRKMPTKLTQIADRLQMVVEKLIKNPLPILVAWSISLLIQGGFVLLNALLGAACNIHLPLHVWFIAWPLAKLFAMLPISMGGLGVREAALALILARYGISFSSSVGLGLLWESVLVAGASIGGIFYLTAKRNDSKQDPMATGRVASRG